MILLMVGFIANMQVLPWVLSVYIFCIYYVKIRPICIFLFESGYRFYLLAYSQVLGTSLFSNCVSQLILPNIFLHAVEVYWCLRLYSLNQT